jgi:hypothetical protein
MNNIKLGALDKINKLEDAVSEMSQAGEFETSHFFKGGMYCRRIEIPVNCLIVSKKHKTEHFFIGCYGELLVYDQDKTYILTQGMVVPSDIGTKRCVLALTDVVCMTVHRVDKDSIDDLENDIVESSDKSLYDFNNAPKKGVITKIFRELENKD